MLNLRQLNKADNTQSNSDAQHFSRFSLEFRVPSDLLGNIGEPLDHSQAEWLHDDEPDNYEAAAEEQLMSAENLDIIRHVTESLDTHQGDEHSVTRGTSRLVAGPSGTRWDEGGATCLGIVGPNTGSVSAKTRGDDEAVDTSSATPCMSGNGLWSTDAYVRVCTPLCLQRCSSKTKRPTLAGVGSRCREERLVAHAPVKVLSLSRAQPFSLIIILFALGRGFPCRRSNTHWPPSRYLFQNDSVILPFRFAMYAVSSAAFPPGSLRADGLCFVIHHHLIHHCSSSWAANAAFVLSLSSI